MKYSVLIFGLVDSTGAVNLKDSHMSKLKHSKLNFQNDSSLLDISAKTDSLMKMEAFDKSMNDAQVATLTAEKLLDLTK